MTTAANSAGKCKTNYVFLEMVLNKDTKYDVIAGLFKGIIEKKGQKFILLQGLKNATNILSVDFYNIMMIEEREGDFKNLTYFTAEKIDQDIAEEMIAKLYENMLAGGMGLHNDPKIIDIDKYTEVPKDYLDGKPLQTGTATAGKASGVGNFASPHTRYQAGTTYTKQTTVKADPEPSLIGRTKTKKPAKAALDIMFAKVQQVTAGEFEPVLPEIMGEDDAGVTEADDTETYGYYGAAGYCG